MPARLDTLAELGFNRLSFGVQDFDPAVQKAVHRVQPAEQVFALVEAARARGFRVDQCRPDLRLAAANPESFDRTLAQVNDSAPGPHCALRLRAPARALQAAAAHRHGGAAQRRRPRCPCCRAPWPPSWVPATCMWAWTTLPCRTTRLARGQAAGPLAPQLPGLQHPADCDSDCPGRVSHRPHRRHLQPKRQDPGGVLRLLGPRALPIGARAWPLYTRRPGAPCGHHGARCAKASCSLNLSNLAYLLDFETYFAAELQYLAAVWKSRVW